MFPHRLKRLAGSRRSNPPAFVVARDGLYLRKQSLLGSVNRGRASRSSPGRKPLLDYRLPKLPAELMGQGRRVSSGRCYERQQTEASCCCCGGTITSNCGAIAIDDIGLRPAQARSLGPAGRVPAWSATIHSHGAFSAFASGDGRRRRGGTSTDSTSRRRTTPATPIRLRPALVVDGYRFGVRQSQVLERPRAVVPPPDEWLARVKGGPAPRRKSWPKAPGAHTAAGKDGGRLGHRQTGDGSTNSSTPRQGSCRGDSGTGPRRPRADLRHDRKERQMPTASSLSVVAASAHSCWRHWFDFSPTAPARPCSCSSTRRLRTWQRASQEIPGIRPSAVTRPRPSPAGLAKQRFSPAKAVPALSRRGERRRRRPKGDVVLLGVDNHRSRKRSSIATSASLSEGHAHQRGNDEIDGNVSSSPAVTASASTAPFRNPPRDRDRDDGPASGEGCAARAAERPQRSSRTSWSQIGDAQLPLGSLRTGSARIARFYLDVVQNAARPRRLVPRRMDAALTGAGCQRCTNDRPGDLPPADRSI